MLSLHDALPRSGRARVDQHAVAFAFGCSPIVIAARIHAAADVECRIVAGGLAIIVVTIVIVVTVTIAGECDGTRQQQCKSAPAANPVLRRSEEHTSELQSLMRISYAVSC